MPSKQAEWQARKAAAGLCIECGQRPRLDTYRLCAGCTLTERLRMRAKGGFAPKKPGQRGRPPRYSDEELKRLALEGQ